jgi:hypothetical protein
VWTDKRGPVIIATADCTDTFAPYLGRASTLLEHLRRRLTVLPSKIHRQLLKPIQRPSATQRRNSQPAIG